MIASVRGEISSVLSDSVVLENHGIGFQIYTPTSFLVSVSAGDEVKLYTYLSVREDALQLFGFPTEDSLHVFSLLIGVSGIGPKGALSILSALSPDELRLAVASGDAKLISRSPGIGAKTAQRLILELKDKLTIDAISVSPDDSASAGMSAAARNGTGKASVRDEAIQALMALGYSSSESAKAIRPITITDDMSVEELLKLALRSISYL